MPRSPKSDDTDLLRRCDTTVEMAAGFMRELGADLEVIIDRMLTYGAALACAQRGSAETARVFRQLADNIEAGRFHKLTGEGGKRH